MKLPFPETETILNALTARLNHQHGTFPAPGNNDFDGYNVISDVGPARELTTVGANIQVPDIDCSKTIVGSSGAAYLTPWVGIDNNTNGGFLAQTGFYAWCTGPAGGHATKGPFYDAWYVVCCNNNIPIDSYQGQPALHPGDLLGFEAARDNSNGSWNFTFADHATNQTFHANLPCPVQYLNCDFNPSDVRSRGFAVTEDPGTGPPAYTMPYWPSADCGSCNNVAYSIDYSGTFIRSYDGSQGSFGNKTNEWSGPYVVGPQSFPGAKLPYAIGGYYDPTTNVITQGVPAPFTGGDTAFFTGCLQVVDSNPQHDLFC